MWLNQPNATSKMAHGVISTSLSYPNNIDHALLVDRNHRQAVVG